MSGKVQEGPRSPSDPLQIYFSFHEQVICLHIFFNCLLYCPLDCQLYCLLIWLVFWHVHRSHTFPNNRCAFVRHSHTLSSNRWELAIDRSNNRTPPLLRIWRITVDSLESKSETKVIGKRLSIGNSIGKSIGNTIK